jgi:hypothetical protein
MLVRRFIDYFKKHPKLAATLLLVNTNCWTHVPENKSE